MEQYKIVRQHITENGKVIYLDDLKIGHPLRALSDLNMIHTLRDKEKYGNVFDVFLEDPKLKRVRNCYRKGKVTYKINAFLECIN